MGRYGTEEGSVFSALLSPPPVLTRQTDPAPSSGTGSVARFRFAGYPWAIHTEGPSRGVQARGPLEAGRSAVLTELFRAASGEAPQVSEGEVTGQGGWGWGWPCSWSGGTHGGHFPWTLRPLWVQTVEAARQRPRPGVCTRGRACVHTRVPCSRECADRAGHPTKERQGTRAGHDVGTKHSQGFTRLKPGTEPC